MKIVRAITSAISCLAVFAAGAAHAQEARPCVPAGEAEALVLSLAPQLIQTTAATCSASLPPSAYLRRPLGQLTSKYAAEEARSWPLAKEALKKLAGRDAAALLDSELAKPMLGSMVAPMLVKELRADDCPAIDRVLAVVDPLPARNTAALIVTILDLAGRKDRRSAISICPGVRSAP